MLQRDRLSHPAAPQNANCLRGIHFEAHVSQNVIVAERLRDILEFDVARRGIYCGIRSSSIENNGVTHCAIVRLIINGQHGWRTLAELLSSLRAYLYCETLLAKIRRMQVLRHLLPT